MTCVNGARLIGLIGRKGAGKDTAAAVLLARGYQNVKFAGGLKEMLRALLAYQGAAPELIERMVEGDLKEAPTDYLAGQTPRHAMQALGTEWGRNLIAPDFWVATAIQAASRGASVLTDVRYPNEKAAIEAAGGTCMGVVADWIVPQEGEHSSEALIDAMISELPSGQVVINRKAAPEEEAFAIQAFQGRFLEQLYRVT